MPEAGVVIAMKKETTTEAAETASSKFAAEPRVQIGEKLDGFVTYTESVNVNRMDNVSACLRAFGVDTKATRTASDWTKLRQ